MPDRTTPADLEDYRQRARLRALRYQGRKRVRNADEIMAEIAANQLVEHLERWDSWS